MRFVKLFATISEYDAEKKTYFSESQSLIGELLCDSCNTVLEIMYVVHQLGRYMTKAMKSHFEVAKHVIRYLEGKLKARV